MLSRKNVTVALFLIILLLSLSGVALAASGINKITGPYLDPEHGYKFTVCADTNVNEAVCTQYNTTGVDYASNAIFGPTALPSDTELICTNTGQSCQTIFGQADLTGTLWDCTIATQNVTANINYAFYVVAGSSCSSGYSGVHSENYTFGSGTTVVDLIDFTADSDTALMVTFSLSLLAAGAGLSLILLMRPKKVS